jgi:RNA polymerase sigma-70 factor (ECF subfamily)
MPLLRSSTATDAQEVQELYQAYVSRVYGFFSYSVGASVAEDLCATTFELAIRSWKSFDPARGTRRTWLFAIARNVLTDHLRRESHRRGPSLDEFPAICESLVTADDPLARLMTVEGVKARLSTLKPVQRKVLALRYGADLPMSEIARLLQLSEANVTQIASRALRRLRADELAARRLGEQALPVNGGHPENRLPRRLSL